MVRVTFAPSIQRHAPNPVMDVQGGSVRMVLEAAFAEHASLRSYVLDDQGSVRKHIVVFVNGTPIADPAGLSDEVAADAEVHVFQALSGG